MVRSMFSRRNAVAVLVAAALLPAAACSPVKAALDNPLTGAEIAISVNQPLQVRLSNVDPVKGAWQYQAAQPKSVTFVGREVRPPESQGVRQLEMFNFTGAAKGSDQVTFRYTQPDGVVTDEIVVKVTVS